MQQKAEVRERAEHIVLRAADGFVRMTSKYMASGDQSGLNQSAELISRDPAFDAVVIFGPNGEVLATAGDGAQLAGTEIAQNLASGGTGTWSGDGYSLGSLSINFGGDVLGSVMIRAQHSNFKQAGSSPITHFGLTLLSIVLLTPGLVLMARALQPPTAPILDAVKKAKPGRAARAFADINPTADPDLRAALSVMGGEFDKAYSHARTLALRDPTTKLPNRVRFMSALDAHLKRQTPVIVLIADLDGFRKVNELVGPRGGDEVLEKVASKMRAAIRAADRTVRTAKFETAPTFLACIGADQFGFVIPDDVQENADRIAQLMGAALSQPIEVEGRSMRLSASFGGAAAPQDANTAAELLKLGELALKHAKKQNSGRVAFYDETLLMELETKARLEEDLRAGVELGEFIAVFQPKVALETGEIVGAEALARWRRPDGSVVSPGVFIPKAEEMGLISKLGIGVLRDACEAAAEWNRGERTCRVAVNVSPLQFQDPDFIPSVFEALEDTGLNPELLELEVTESAAINDPERVTRIMRPLRAKGVRLSIDDFGTGHSNFTTVTRLPFDVFKIDQQFVRALSEDPHAPAIVEMILAMAETLGQETVAEGVETAAQADFLRRRACTVGQGYYFSPPLPREEFLSFLHAWRPDLKFIAAA